jgi:hypothetical protein
LGVLDANNNAAVEVAKESGQNADPIVWENIVKLYARMLPVSLGRAVWVCSIDISPELATMALTGHRRRPSLDGHWAGASRR